MKLSSESKHVVQIFDLDFKQSCLAFILIEHEDQDLEKDIFNKTISQTKYFMKTNFKYSYYTSSTFFAFFFGDRLITRFSIFRQGPNGTYGFSTPEVH